MIDHDLSQLRMGTTARDAPDRAPVRFTGQSIGRHVARAQQYANRVAVLGLTSTRGG